MTNPPPTSHHPPPNGVTANSFTNSFHKEIGERVGCHPIYVELHARSAFSFLEGSSTPEELVARAVELKQPSLALLARDNVSGAARFHMPPKKARTRAHIDAQ